MGALKIVLLSIIVLVFVCSHASCTEFEAGGENGWKLPTSNQVDIFNEWASKNRFKVGDTIRFTYKKDSVMEVSEDEYKQCQTTKPLLYSNHDDKVFPLDRPGLFYFISGVSGHCEKGQKMIIKVMELESPPQSPPPTSSLPSSPHKAKSNHAVRRMAPFVGAGLVALSALVFTLF